MKYNFKVGTWFGAPIYINIFVSLFVLIYLAQGDVLSAIISGICFVFLMLAHEMGHAWFVKKYGHELIGIHIYPIHGYCEYEFDSTYEPETLIYAGGLIVQAALLIFFIGFLGLLDVLGLQYLQHLMAPIGRVFVQANLLLLVLNSLPIRGFDGFMLWKRLYEIVCDKLNVSPSINFLKRKQRRKPKSKKPKMSPEKVVDLAIERAKRK